MRRWALIVGLLAAMLAAGPLGAQPEPGTATAGTETESESESEEDRRTLLQATLARPEATPLELRLLRITLEPGGTSPWHAHPGLEFGVVESGTLLVETRGPAVVRRAADDAAPTSEVPAETAVELAVGDRIAYAPGTEMTFRNAGSAAAVLLVGTVLPAGPDAPPGVVFADGPPAAEEVGGVRSQQLAAAVIEQADFPGSRGVVVLERLAVDAGESVPAFAGPVVLALDAGTLEGEFVADPAATPAPGSGSAATPSADGTAFRLGPGESLYLPAGMAATAPLGGEGEASLLRFGIVAVAADPDPGMASPSPAPNPSADESRIVRVAVAEARLRAEPSAEATVLAGLEAGRELVVTGPPVDADGLVWYPVADAADPTIAGFVAADLLEE